MSDLAKRLRSAIRTGVHHGDRELAEAADRIEALEAEIERLRGMCDAHLGALERCADSHEELRRRIPDSDDLRYALGLLDDLLRDKPEPFDRRTALANLRAALPPTKEVDDA